MDFHDGFTGQRSHPAGRSRENGSGTRLERAWNAQATSRDLDATLRALLSGAPEAFCAAVLSLLGAEPDSSRCRSIYDRVANYREFWLEMMRPGRFGRAQLIDICRHFMTIEEVLDMRLARLTAGRGADGPQLDSEAVLRLLDLLDELSPGTRLVLLLNHLTECADRRIASKAALLVGRRLRNPGWVDRHLTSSDGRIRANTLEGLWGVRCANAVRALCASLKDKNNRVVGNALIGLHQLGEPGVNEFVMRMIEDSRPPFRWTAAWVMGRIAAEEFRPCLQKALHDKERHVQRAAERALAATARRAGDQTSGPGPDPLSADPTNASNEVRVDESPPGA